MVSLILDAVVATLLVATIWFAIQLNTRLKILRADGERMERLIAGLSAASHQAEEAVGDLKETAGHAGRQLQTAIDKAQSLLADLQFMTDKADAAADQLDDRLREQRGTVAKTGRRDPESRAADVAAAALLADAAPPEIRPKRVDPPNLRTSIEADQNDKEIKNRLASLLKQAEASSRPAARAKPPAPVAPAPPAATPARPPDEGETARPIALQSRAEREFMKALEARK